jgi:hypothetical protein
MDRVVIRRSGQYGTPPHVCRTKVGLSTVWLSVDHMKRRTLIAGLGTLAVLGARPVLAQPMRRVVFFTQLMQ